MNWQPLTIHSARLRPSQWGWKGNNLVYSVSCRNLGLGRWKYRCRHCQWWTLRFRIIQWNSQWCHSLWQRAREEGQSWGEEDSVLYMMSLRHAEFFQVKMPSGQLHIRAWSTEGRSQQHMWIWGISFPFAARILKDYFTLAFHMLFIS